LATDRIEDLPVLDVCLVCVKSYDLPQVIQRLGRSVSDTTSLLPLLNGIDIYERIRADLDVGLVLPACVYVSAHIEAPGKVVQQSAGSKILLGKDPRMVNRMPHALLALFDQSGINYEWLDDVSPALWSKYVFIAAFGLVGASFDKTLGQMMGSPRLSEHVQAVMREIIRLAEKKGVVLPETIVAESYQKGRDFAPETKTSFQRDFEEAGRPDERDLFGGTILRLGRQLGVATPATQELCEIIERRKPWPV